MDFILIFTGCSVTLSSWEFSVQFSVTKIKNKKQKNYSKLEDPWISTLQSTNLKNINLYIFAPLFCQMFESDMQQTRYKLHVLVRYDGRQVQWQLLIVSQQYIIEVRSICASHSTSAKGNFILSTRAFFIGLLHVPTISNRDTVPSVNKTEIRLLRLSST